ncbi:MAG: SPOR domain-containing protein [Chitinophagaceae bacterium]|nr:MAG: SPOR domain-containing protein [Chitinophagaceae bacterium]
MKKWLLFMLLAGLLNSAVAQPATPAPSADSAIYGTVIVNKDRRIDILGEKMYAYNVGLAKNIRSGKGYRLMLLSTNDRDAAMSLRSKLLQQYPDHKVYMAYQSPFIKLKMGNFVEKADAEKLKKQLLAQRLVTGNIYVLPETIEIKPEPEEDNE